MPDTAQRKAKQRKIYLPDVIWESLRAQTDYQYDSNGGQGLSISALVYDILDCYVSSPPEEQRRIRCEVRARRLEKQMRQLDNTPNDAFLTVPPSGRIEGGAVVNSAEVTTREDDLWDFGQA